MSVQEQYDTYPYPARDPKEERKRLILGSPSYPAEIDHYVFAGLRDWSKPIRILVAGGGTGDGLVQMAQILTSAGRPYEITYLDLSQTARGIAEARVAERALNGVTFHTASLLDAPEYGVFDYIDCCGVLHHLPDPAEGFRALAGALAPEGGIGLMVYAPFGRSGVYPLQSALNALSHGMSASDRLALGKSVLKVVPDAHPFKRNTVLRDHEASDAGFYDLLLHSCDRPYSVAELTAELDAAGLEPSAFLPSALYDLARLLPDGVRRPEGMSDLQSMAVAEELLGTIKSHVVYAVHCGRADKSVARPSDLRAVPHLKSIAGPDLARLIADRQKIEMEFQGQPVAIELRPDTAPLIAQIDGSTPLAAIRDRAGLDGFLFSGLWGSVHKALVPWGELHYSRIFT